MNNPYLEEVAGRVTVGTDREQFDPDRAVFPTERGVMVERYAWAIPNEEAVDTVAGLSPVLEVGAGKGYWARMVKDAGGDILATDPDPPAADREWFPVWRAGAQDVVPDYPDRTLMMVWPTDGDYWSVEALGMYGGDTVIYVGEGRTGATATDRFHEMLFEEWELAETVDIPTFFGMRDRLEVWERP